MICVGYKASCAVGDFACYLARTGRVRACNFINFETGQNLLPVLCCACCVQGCMCVDIHVQAIVAKHVTGCSIFSTVQEF